MDPMKMIQGRNDSTIEIAGRAVGAGFRTLVIAEIGVNHDGSVRRAVELVDLAAAAGADAVKLQVFRAGALVHASAISADYQRRSGEESQAQMLRRLELSDECLRVATLRIRQRGMIALATPFSIGDVATIAELRLPAIKIASPDLVNRPLMTAAAGLKVPMIVSTGGATMEEVATSVGWLREWGAKFCLLHCTSAYPAGEADANLCWIAELAAAARAPIGFSDHTSSELAGALAVAAGACVVEKHLTYDRSAAGPDHAASADAAEFGQYVALIRQAEKLRGRPGKRVLECETDMRQVSRQSLVAARDVGEGQELREGDLMVQRPGSGISAARIKEVVGRRVVVAVRKGTILKWEQLGNAA